MPKNLSALKKGMFWLTSNVALITLRYSWSDHNWFTSVAMLLRTTYLSNLCRSTSRPSTAESTSQYSTNRPLISDWREVFKACSASRNCDLRGSSRMGVLNGLTNVRSQTFVPKSLLLTCWQAACIQIQSSLGEQGPFDCPRNWSRSTTPRISIG